jgi:lipid II:glycine glycyltransferase (peptidoglycan interpeptide bridge formation enzyme)
MKDLRQTPQYALYMQKIGWTAEWENGCFYYIKWLPLLGGIIKFQRPEKIDHHDIESIAKKHRIFQIILEPKNEEQTTVLKAKRFKLNKSPYLPSKTIHVHLNRPEEEIRMSLHQKTRYNIKIAQRNGIEVMQSHDIDQFADFWQTCAKKQRGMFLSQKKEIKEIWKAFGENANLIFAYHNKILTGAILLLHTGDISYYMYAASTDDGKKLFVPTYLVWKAILQSKWMGSQIFDFEGIYDDRFPLPTWKGFSKFKKSWGGEEVMYPGCYIKWRLPV